MIRSIASIFGMIGLLVAATIMQMYAHDYLQSTKSKLSWWPKEEK